MVNPSRHALIAIGVLFAFVVLFLNAVLWSPASDTEHVYYLQAGQTKRAVITELYQNQLISHPSLFRVMVSFLPFGQLKAGEYAFPKGSTPLSIWRQITSGSGLYYRPFTIIPGWTFKQLRQALEDNLWLKHTLSNVSDEQIMTLLGVPQQLPEGMFYPDTYFFKRNDNDVELLKQAFDLMQKKLNQAYHKRVNDLPYRHPYDALIAASLIEKEGRIDSERPLIASVLVNRLNKNMLLQIDATVIYALGDHYQGTIYKNDLNLDSVYNTYRHKGLPPTPIAIPGMPSILAALHPSVSSYYYYVAKADGSHQFSQTLQEHHQAIKTKQLMQKAQEKRG